jgi:hypothetical protein
MKPAMILLLSLLLIPALILALFCWETWKGWRHSTNKDK